MNKKEVTKDKSSIIENCRLCQKTTKLCDSHIIPSFVIQHLKDTSSTGYLRQAINPNLRLQDFGKKKLLCSDCETLFSKWENLFKKQIFSPHQEHKYSFEYGQWLALFILSISWRVLVENINHFENFKSDLIKAERNWRAQLLSETPSLGKYNHYIVFLDEIASTTSSDLPPRFHSYLLRACDATLAYNKNSIFIYTKLLNIVVVSPITPTKLRGFNGANIKMGGVLCTKQFIEANGFGDFLITRANDAIKLYSDNLSDKQNTKIESDIVKDVDKFTQSKTFSAIIADRRLKKIYK